MGLHSGLRRLHAAGPRKKARRGTRTRLAHAARIRLPSFAAAHFTIWLTQPDGRELAADKRNSCAADVIELDDEARTDIEYNKANEGHAEVAAGFRNADTVAVGQPTAATVVSPLITV